MKEMNVALFKADDTDDPGLAKVRLLKQARIIGGHGIWRVEVLTIVRPSAIRKLKAGQKLEVSEGLLSPFEEIKH